jgi:tellurite resistance protein TerC
MLRRFIIASYLQAKRIVVIVVGFTVLLIGVIMIALPGPAIIVIPLGLAILATEFIWARRLLRRFKKTVNHIKTPRKARRIFNFIKTKILRSVSPSLKKDKPGETS